MRNVPSFSEACGGARLLAMKRLCFCRGCLVLRLPKSDSNAMGRDQV